MIRKPFLFFCCAMLIGGSLAAQLSRGSWVIGGNIAFTSQKFTEDDSKSNTLELSPMAGYFIMDKLAVGLKTSISRFSADDDTHLSLLAGPFARFYFLPVASKTNVLLEGHFMGGTDKYKGFDAEGQVQYGFSAGPAFFLNPHVALETLINWRSRKFADDDGRYNNIGLSIGLQVHLLPVKKSKRKSAS
jgi:hypothetical protein